MWIDTGPPTTLALPNLLLLLREYLLLDYHPNNRLLQEIVVYEQNLLPHSVTIAIQLLQHKQSHTSKS